MEIDGESLDLTLVGGSQEPLSSPAECLARLLHTEEYADLTLVLPGIDKTIKVHRMVLAMWSPVFKAMLFGPLSESGSIELPEDHPEAFKWMLNYMYSGCTQLPSVDLAVHIYLLSNKYQMDHLKLTCSKYLIDSVSGVSVPQVRNVATLLEDDALLRKCNEILETSPDKVFSSPSIGSFTSNSLQQILGLDIPISSETIIFQGLLTWGRSQLKLGDENITPANLRRKIEDFLPNIRFLAMTADEFVRNVLPEFIMTLEESTYIQQLIIGIEGVNKPKACSNIINPRKGFLISDLECCCISYDDDGTLGYGSYSEFNEGEERKLFSSIKVKDEIFLSKLESYYDIEDTGQLIVRDSTGLDIATVEFNNHEAVFKNRLKLVPGQEYSFVLKGKEASLYEHSYNISENELLSGVIENYFDGNFEIYYWKQSI